MVRRILAVVLASAACTGVALEGCSNSNGSGSSPATGSTIGAQGGTVTTGDGSSVTIPPGAIAAGSSVNVSMTLAPNAPALPASDGVAVGPTYLLSPEGQQFLAPVAVTLAFDPTRLPAGTSANDVVVFTSPATGTPNFATLPTTVADATHVSAQTTHFSWVLAGIVHKVTSGSDGGPDASTADGSTDAGAADVAIDVTADASVDTGSDAPSDTGAGDASFACTQPADPAPAITETGVCAPAPASTGGTIVDGTYYLTQSVAYRTGDAGCGPGNPTAQGTIVVAGGMMSLVYTTPSLNWYVGPYTTNGTSLNLAAPCADGGLPNPLTVGYSATSTTLSISFPVSSGQDVGTLTKQ
jgi:hypothetical protein